jgi:hypothetical protein
MWIYRFRADPKSCCLVDTGGGRPACGPCAAAAPEQCCQSAGQAKKKDARQRRAPFVSASGSALGSVPTVALSSVQLTFILTTPLASSEETARKK